MKLKRENVDMKKGLLKQVYLFYPYMLNLIQKKQYSNNHTNRYDKYLSFLKYI